VKKIALIITVMSVLCMTSNAQEKVGRITIKPTKGITISKISGWEYSKYTKNNTSYTEGVEAEFIVKPWLGISTGVSYVLMESDIYIHEKYIKSMGRSQYMDQLNPSFYDRAKTKYRTLDGPVAHDYLTVPVLANFHIFKGFSVSAGVQTGFLLSSKIKTNYIYEQLTETLEEEICKPDIEYYDEIERKNFCKNFDMGIPVGISYEYRKITLDARYYFGLTNIMKSAGEGRNRYLTITLGYKFKVR